MNLCSAKVLVTGGASGLGLAVVNRLLEEGAHVAILDIHKPHDNVQFKDAHYFEGDVTDEASVDRTVAQAAKMLDGLSLAVNCAGMAHSQRVVGHDSLHSTEDFVHIIKVNLLGTFMVSRAAANTMQHNAPSNDGERGVIINTASVAAYEGQIGQAAYAASKGGIASLTLPLAREFASFGVRVMSIAPGIFDTPLLDGLSPSAIEHLKQITPFPKRPGKPEEFADTVCHIYCNPMLNGEVIRLDGGLRMPPK